MDSPAADILIESWAADSPASVTKHDNRVCLVGKEIFSSRATKNLYGSQNFKAGDYGSWLEQAGNLYEAATVSCFSAAGNALRPP